jgi:predicted Zn-dependent peptidase
VLTVDSLTERETGYPPEVLLATLGEGGRGALFFEVRFQQSLLALSSSIFFGFWSRDASWGRGSVPPATPAWRSA